ncbi:hypothetical protein AX769_05785 [Frondihabitans sp. PAMC 28766]|nr:hypothetical protein AX769_05785 [Frondihabitans sp. PAMC 28766]
MLERDRQLLQVADAVDLEDVDEARDRAMVKFHDEKKSRLRQSSGPRGRRRPRFWFQTTDQELIGVVLDLLDDLEVLLFSKADTGHVTSVELTISRTP